MFAKSTPSPKPSKRASATVLWAVFTNILLGTLGGWIIFPLLSQSAIAAETLSAQNIKPFKQSNAVNGILCITACNEFFESGQASFELEIQRLQNRIARPAELAPILQIDPSLLEALEEQRETESRQNL